MMVLLPFMDVLSLSHYLKRLVREIPAIRLASLWRGQDVPVSYISGLRIVLLRFLKISQEAKEKLSKQDLSQNAGDLAILLYFTIIQAQNIYDVLNNESIPTYLRMRDISDESFKEVEEKLSELIHLLSAT